MSKVVVFLDTNIFLHYQPFDQINWAKEFEVDKVELAVAPIVIRELDDKKDNHSISNIRDRARTALRKIESLITGQDDVDLLEGVQLVCTDEPKLSFIDYNLRTDINDDHLIACCIERKNLENGEKVIVVTNDTGPRIKAHKHSIKSSILPKNFKLPSATSQIEKENKELQSKIQQLEDSLPILHLGFEDESQDLQITIQRPLEVDEDKIKETLKEIKNKYPKKYPAESNPPSSNVSEQLTQMRRIASMQSTFNKPSKKEYERYNSTLDEYYQSYEEYLYSLIKNKKQNNCTFKIEIALFNQGTAPAHDIDVFMHFPDGFILLSEDGFPGSPKLPTPPRKPMSSLEILKSQTVLPLIPKMSTNNISNFPTSGSNISSPNIKETNSYEVEYSVKKLKQHLRAPCEKLYVCFRNREDISSFGIDYRINAANIPREIKGKLNVVFENKENQ